ncbi:hypothetical protein RUM43_006305 [Polyplax serrata]|uniref:Torso-like protein n=1 Tax=Polyplax serrata TaxID=468196 RepID=A0AAN8PYK0_POLSC
MTLVLRDAKMISSWIQSFWAFSGVVKNLLRTHSVHSSKVKLSRLRRTNICGLIVLVIVLGGHVNASSELRLGGAINLFSRYGYLSISMRVVPRNDSDSKWLYREPTIDIFKDLSTLVLTPASQDRVKVFEGDFHMEFCDNLRQLLQAYFRGFNFERLDRPWRAFSGSWSRSGMAKHLGINSSYITGHYCYVLVRVARHRESGRMQPVGDDIELDEEVARGTNDVIPGDEASVSHFIKSFGSHYIVSYTTGNSLYQVREI